MGARLGGGQVLFAKPHSLVTVWISAKSLPRKRGPQKSLLGVASRLPPPPAPTGPDYSRVCCPAVRDQAVSPLPRLSTPQAVAVNNRSASPWKGCIWVSQAEWIHPTNFHHQMLCGLFPSLLLGEGSLCGVEISGSWSEGVLQPVLQPWHPPSFCCTWVWEFVIFVSALYAPCSVNSSL